MGCTSSRSVRVHPEPPGPRADPKPKAVPVASTLRFEEATLDDFSQQRQRQEREERLRQAQRAVEECVVEEAQERVEVEKMQDTERDYVNFDIEEMYEQAKLLEDIRTGVIPENQFVLHPGEDFRDYVPPFLHPTPTTAAAGAKTKAAAPLPTAAKQAAPAGTAEQVAAAMAAEFDEEFTSPGSSNPGRGAAGLPNLIADDGLEEDWAPHRKRLKGRA
eukprot:RCo034877